METLSQKAPLSWCKKSIIGEEHCEPSLQVQAGQASGKVISRRILHSSDESDDDSSIPNSPALIKRRQPKTAFSSSSSSFDGAQQVQPRVILCFFLVSLGMAISKGGLEKAF